MRIAVAGAFFACLLSSPSAFTASVVTGDPVVMPDTPSGEGDPSTIVCRAPQQLSGNDRLGPKSCGYNYEWAQLTAHGKDLASDGKMVIDRRTVSNPKGKGNPDAVTCREPKLIGPRGMALRIQHYGPEVCETNRFWANLNKSRKIVAENGAIVPELEWWPTTVSHPQPYYQPPPK